MPTGVWILLLALALATAFGLWRRARDGRFRGSSSAAPGGSAAPSTGGPAAAAAAATAALDDSDVLGATDLGAPLGERATLLQFSTAFCAPCRATRQILGDVAASLPGVAHVEIDAEHHLDLVRRVGILRTPTTLVLDAAGHEVARAAGAPTRATVLATLAERLAIGVPEGRS